MTYLLMSLPFLGIALAVFLAGLVSASRNGSATRKYLAGYATTTIVLVVLTAIFDNVMMAAGFFDYGQEQISGLRFILMPVEDFFYPVAAALLIAGIWQFFGARPSTSSPKDLNDAASHRVSTNRIDGIDSDEPSGDGQTSDRRNHE